jgi:microcystin-dependent protein
MADMPARPDDQMIGEIRLFSGNYAPQGFFFCNGAPLPISDYIALYSLIGTTYGGDGQTTFNLPDLRGRVPVHYLGTYPLGTVGGAEQVALLESNLPAHTHPVKASDKGGSDAPKDNAWGPGTTDCYKAPLQFMSQMSTLGISTAGKGVAHDNMSPFLCVNFIIAYDGVFPTHPNEQASPLEQPALENL